MSQPAPKNVANVDRLHDYMDRNGLGAVVARSGQNFTYLSGIAYPGTLARLLDLTDSPRGVMVFWPRHGEPSIILNKTAEPLTRRDSWIKQLELYEGYSESPYARLAAVIKKAGLADAKIGLEKNFVSAGHWEELATALPRAKLVDCTKMMDEVRWLKSPHEIALLKAGADLLDNAYLDAFRATKPGDTERMVHSRIMYNCLSRGAGWAHGILASSTNPTNYGSEGDTVFQRGDIIRDDYIAYCTAGYPGHQSRNAIFGKPSAEQKREYEIIRDIYDGTIERCQPGVRSSDVFMYVVKEFEKQGWEYKPMLVGHGMGSWWHQQEPIMSRTCDIVLEEGMVLAIEPHRGHWHIQDMIVVAKNGPKLISDAFSTREMFVIE
ncbi:MAG TPA: Xaa-Pro peptidase family protein [Pseudolabrys sp.]|nr:Xaa-Pro peptidase family protein [Pseudolabrys sp.]